MSRWRRRSGSGSPDAVAVRVTTGDAREVPGDVLVLKHAQQHHGVDEAVARRLGRALTPGSLAPGEDHLVTDVGGALGVAAVLVVGTPGLHRLRYRELRAFPATALAAVARRVPTAAEVVMTLHGPGYGLDELECARAQVVGLVDAAAALLPPGLRQITLVEADPRRAARLSDVVGQVLPGGVLQPDGSWARSHASPWADVGAGSEERPVGYVAMAMSGATEDLFRAGIEPAVTAAGLLCERLVPTAADPVDRATERIRTARVVVADVTGGHPNVFLQVGYAWGVGVPVVVLMGTGEETRVVPFDVASRVDVVYRGADQLRHGLAEHLAAVLAPPASVSPGPGPATGLR